MSTSVRKSRMRTAGVWGSGYVSRARASKMPFSVFIREWARPPPWRRSRLPAARPRDHLSVVASGGCPSRRAPIYAAIPRSLPRPAHSAPGQRPDQAAIGIVAHRSLAISSDNRGGTELRRDRGPGPGLSYAVRRLFYAGMHREDIDEARGFQNVAHRLLRSGQAQVTASSPSPFPYSQQHRQAAVADAVQTRQVDDDRWPAGRHGRDQMRRDARDVRQAKLPAQGDDCLTVGIADADIYLKHGLPS